MEMNWWLQCVAFFYNYCLLYGKIWSIINYRRIKLNGRLMIMLDFVCQFNQVENGSRIKRGFKMRLCSSTEKEDFITERTSWDESQEWKLFEVIQFKFQRTVWVLFAWLPELESFCSTDEQTYGFKLTWNSANSVW